MNSKTLKKIVSIAVNAVLYFFLALCIFSVFFTIFSKKDPDGAANIFGHQMRLVISRSMEESDATDVSDFEIKSLPLNSMVFVDLVPEDGWILEPVEVTFREGESVFNVLQRVCKQKKIHMEFMNTPIYNSAYIEGIANFYEFDVGELSGWMYKVNEWFPNYGCSRYRLNDGDVICWEYTCDLGADIGDTYLMGSQGRE